MTYQEIGTLLSELSVIDYLVICTNLLLIVFAHPILKRFSSSSLSQKVFDLRYNLLRAINVIILIAYGYQVIYAPVDEQGILVKTISILAIVYVSYICNYFLQYIINKHYGKTRQIGDNVIYVQTYKSRLLSIIAAVLLIVIAIISCVRILEFDSLLEAGGVLGVFGVLLALTQSSWAPDIISGLIILNSDMFEEGDIVEFEKVIGRVHRTKLFHTEIINLRNNHRIMLRNANMRDHIIHNLSKFASGMGLRECLSFNIGYDTESSAVKEMLCEAFNDAVEAGVEVESNPEPQVKLLKTGDHALEWGLLFHVKKVEQLIPTRRELREHILAQSIKHNIQLATPITQVVTYQKNDLTPDQAP